MRLSKMDYYHRDFEFQKDLKTEKLLKRNLNQKNEVLLGLQQELRSFVANNKNL